MTYLLERSPIHKACGSLNFIDCCTLTEELFVLPVAAKLFGLGAQYQAVVC